MNRNTYKFHQPSTNQSSCLSYILDIEMAQNRLRTKLPQISSYQPNSHFDYLSKGGKSICQDTLRSILVFKDERQHGYIGFQAPRYIAQATHRLNTGHQMSSKASSSNYQQPQFDKTSGLQYGGYMRLITTQRMVDYSGGSEVNEYFIERYAKQTRQKYNRQCNEESGLHHWHASISRMLKNPLNHISKYLKNVNGELVSSKQGHRKHEHLFNISDSSRNVKHKNINTRPQYSNYSPEIQKYYDAQPQVRLIQYENQCYSEMIPSTMASLRKPIFSFENKYHHRRRVADQINCKVPALQSKEIKYQTVETCNSYETKQNWTHSPYTNSNAQLSHQDKQFLSRFSSEANVWKNVAPRNWDYKQQPTTRRSETQTSQSNAFIQQDVASTPRIYLETLRDKQRSIPKRRINY